MRRPELNPERTPRKLLIEEGDDVATFEVLDDRIILGRDPSADVALDDHRISRHHAEVRRVGGRLILEDLGSSNGTEVNGLPIFAAHELEPGDVIQIGDHRVFVDRHDAAPPPRAEAPAPRAARPASAPAKARPATHDPAPPSEPVRSPRRRPRSLQQLGITAGALLVVGFVVFQIIKGLDTPAGGEKSDRQKSVPEQAEVETPAPKQPPTAKDLVEPGAGLSLRDRFDHACGEGRWLAAQHLLKRLGSPPELQAYFENGQQKAVLELKAQAKTLSSGMGPELAAQFLKDAIRKFPLDGKARRELTTCLLKLPVPGRPQRAVAQADPKPKETTDPRRPAKEGTTARPVAKKPTRRVPPTRARAMEVEVADKIRKAMDALGREKIAEAEALFAAAEKELLPTFHPRHARQVRRGQRAIAHRKDLVAALVATAGKDPSTVGRVPHLPGKSGALLGIDGEGVTVSNEGKPLKLKWRVLPNSTLRALVRKVRLPAAALVDAAAVLYRAEDSAAADKVLARALRRDAAVKPKIDQLLTDVRMLATVPKAGFALVDDRWLSPRQLARLNLNSKLKECCEKLQSEDAAERKAAFDTLMGVGDAARSRLHSALLLAKAEVMETMKSNGAWETLSQLGRMRTVLDQRRQHALELIFDKRKYPYPYRPPAASAEAAALYKENQPEVVRRVSAVRELWDDPRSSKIPQAFRTGVSRIRELNEWIRTAAYGELREDAAWLMNLPKDDTLFIRNVATSDRDRERLDKSVEVMALNESQPGKAERGEVVQTRITNEYRLLLGRWALRIYDPMVVASHGHCVDMERLGFFAHTSPVKGKRTPSDRLRAAGMRAMGAGENIARSGGPQGAHNGWIRSPGHHRNILGQAWRLMGPGHSGRLWCQVFSVSDGNVLERQRREEESSENEDDEGGDDTTPTRR